MRLCRLFLPLVLLFPDCNGAVFAQVKITHDVEFLPNNFSLIDPVVLSENLKRLLANPQLAGKSNQSIQNGLKRKLIYENLTSDDLFAFSLIASSSVNGDSVDGATSFHGKLYRLIPATEFPEPQVVFVTSCGTGSGSRYPFPVTKREDLVHSYDSAVSSSLLWKTGVLHLKTVVRDERAQNSVVIPGTLCDQSKITVPSEQSHYALSFAKIQPFRLVRVNDSVFSLDTYRYRDARNAGVVAWLPEGRPFGMPPVGLSPDVLFITKLIAPYIKTETFTAKDRFGNKLHRSTRVRIYVDLVGIWQYDRETRRILAKIGSDIDSESEKSSSPGEIVFSGRPDEDVQIIKKPRAKYTVAARRNRTQGDVVIRVTFLASGAIGTLRAIKGLPDGLTEAALAAAKQIRFKPAKKDGIPVSVRKTLAYSFLIE